MGIVRWQARVSIVWRTVGDGNSAGFGGWQSLPIDREYWIAVEIERWMGAPSVERERTHVVAVRQIAIGSKRTIQREGSRWTSRQCSIAQWRKNLRDNETASFAAGGGRPLDARHTLHEGVDGFDQLRLRRRSAEGGPCRREAYGANCMRIRFLI